MFRTFRTRVFKNTHLERKTSKWTLTQSEGKERIYLGDPKVITHRMSTKVRVFSPRFLH